MEKKHAASVEEITEDPRIYSDPELTLAEGALYEMIMCAVEEFRLGRSTSVRITRLSPCEWTLEDDGGGVPLGYNGDLGVEVWEPLFCHSPNGTAKHYLNGILEKRSPSARYKANIDLFYGGKLPKYPHGERVRGFFGICEQLNALSEYLEVQSVYAGEKMSVRFERGASPDGLKNDADITRGARFRWKFDSERLDRAEVPFSMAARLGRSQAMLNAGLTVTLTDIPSNKSYTYCFPNGIEDAVERLSADPRRVIRCPELCCTDVIRFPDFLHIPSDIHNEKRIEACVGIAAHADVELYHNFRRMTDGDTAEAVEDALHIAAEVMQVYPEYLKNHLVIIVHTMSDYTRWSDDRRRRIFDPVLEMFVRDSILYALTGEFADEIYERVTSYRL